MLTLQIFHSCHSFLQHSCPAFAEEAGTDVVNAKAAHRCVLHRYVRCCTRRDFRITTIACTETLDVVVCKVHAHTITRIFSCLHKTVYSPLPFWIRSDFELSSPTLPSVLLTSKENMSVGNA